MSGIADNPDFDLFEDLVAAPAAPTVNPDDVIAEAISMEAEREAQLRAMRREIFLRTDARPPFSGPIGPLDSKFVADAMQAATNCIYCSYALGTTSGFVRKDSLPGDRNYHTYVDPAGEVSTWRYGSTRGVGAGRQLCMVLYVNDFDHAHAVESYMHIVRDYRAQGIVQTGDDPLVEVTEVTDETTVWRFRRTDGGLRWWFYTFDGGVIDEGSILDGLPSGRASIPRKLIERGLEVSLTGRPLVRFATKLAAGINRSREPDLSSCAQLEQSLTNLAVTVADHLRAVRRFAFVRNLDLWLSTERMQDFTCNAGAAVYDLNKNARELRAAFDACRPERERDASPLADARDLCAQLEALGREFDGVRINRFRKTISVVTRPITIVDPQFEVDVEFGRFKITLACNTLDDPVSECFSARALNPRRILHPEKSSDLSHPHVHGNAICAGSAADPIRVLLKQARIYEAFLVVNTLLTVYSKSGHPYAPPWMWYYTPAEAEKLLQEQRDLEDEEDEENICEGCGHELDYCECRQCHDCGDTFNSEETGGLCGACEEYFCGEHLLECAHCSTDRCVECSNTCEGCRETYCEDCIASCRACGAQRCHNCSHDCTECGEPHCRGCLSECPNCAQRICARCLTESHGETCPRCSKLVCADFDRCFTCGESICPECAVQPADEDGAVVCRSCASMAVPVATEGDPAQLSRTDEG